MKTDAPASDAALAEALIDTVIAAGDATLAVRSGTVAVASKADASPVTAADHAAEAIILKALAVIAPDIPVIAEESVAAGTLPDTGREFFLVDPLDGTKEFVKGGNDYTVNVALVRDRVPVVGLVFAPATGALYVGVAGNGAWTAKVADKAIASRSPIRVRAVAAGAAIDVVASKSHRTPETDEYIARYKVRDLVSAGSSLKFCLVAEGKADLYPRMGTTMQWDTAAGDAVLRAAGGSVVTIDGAVFPYGPNGAAGIEAFKNPWFVAAGGIALAAPARK